MRQTTPSYIKTSNKLRIRLKFGSLVCLIFFKFSFKLPKRPISPKWLFSKFYVIYSFLVHFTPAYLGRFYRAYFSSLYLGRILYSFHSLLHTNKPLPWLILTRFQSFLWLSPSRRRPKSTIAKRVYALINLLSSHHCAD